MKKGTWHHLYPCFPFIALYAGLQLFKGIIPAVLLNSILLMVSTSVFCLTYVDIPTKFVADLKAVLKLFVLQALISIPVYLLFNDLLENVTVNDTYGYRTFLHLFYYNMSSFNLGGLTINRINGLMWESGCLQIFANMYLFIRSYQGKSISRSWWVVLVILFTISSTGFLLLAANLFYYFFMRRGTKLATFLLAIPVVVVVMFFSVSAAYQKLISDTSGLIRLSDMVIGARLMLLHPLTGVNMSDLMNNPDFMRLEEDFWGMGSKMISYNAGNIMGGFTNGVFFILISWGAVLGAGIFYLFFRSAFLPSTKFALGIFIIYFVSSFSEPVTDTAFFYLFVLSSIIIGRRSSIGGDVSAEPSVPDGGGNADAGTVPEIHPDTGGAAPA